MLRRTKALLGAGSASLPPQWNLPPEALADLLESARARWSTEAPSASPPSTSG